MDGETASAMLKSGQLLMEGGQAKTVLDDESYKRAMMTATGQILAALSDIAQSLEEMKKEQA